MFKPIKVNGGYLYRNMRWHFKEDEELKNAEGGQSWFYDAEMWHDLTS